MSKADSLRFANVSIINKGDGRVYAIATIETSNGMTYKTETMHCFDGDDGIVKICTEIGDEMQKAIGGSK